MESRDWSSDVCSSDLGLFPSHDTLGLLQSTLTLSKNSNNNQQQTYKQGYLSKKPLKASKSNFKYKFKGWKKRWFVLQKQSIYYYKDAAAAAAAQLHASSTLNNSFHGNNSSSSSLNNSNNNNNNSSSSSTTQPLS